jgi:valine--pyruvate aminotransferase
MEIKLSKFGSRMSELTGVRAIMKDIIETLKSSKDKSFINFSAGNPVIIPEVDRLWRKITNELQQSSEFSNVVGRYGASNGYEPFIEAVINDYNKRFNLQLTKNNILVNPGSQMLYFVAANAFSGYDANGNKKDLMLPIVPEYTGYGGVALHNECIKSYKPLIEVYEDTHEFKYLLDRENIKIDESTGCIFSSRPCNPTGNIMKLAEVEFLVNRAKEKSVPIFFDSAYASPYPALNFTDMSPIFGGNVAHCVTLSKAGLPGERVGFVIAEEEIIKPLEAFQTNACLHSSRMGQALATIAINSGELQDACLNFVRPFYQERMIALQEAADRFLPKSLPWYLHRGEGSIFAWLWFKDLPISDWELYNTLKINQVIVVPGSTFFPGIKEEGWKHQRECIRLSLTTSKEDIAQGLKIIGETISKVYSRF